MANKVYKIMGKYKGSSEELDTAFSKSEAIALAYEYRLAFGQEWVITIK